MIKKKKIIKLWTSKKSDRIFSYYIRHRDKWKCRLCKKNFSNKREQLHNSHFWGRGRSSTRYDSNNCMAACYYCHYFKLEKEKQGLYREIMIDWHGKKKYDELEIKAKQIMKRSDSIKEFMEWMIPILIREEKKFNILIERTGIKRDIQRYKNNLNL